MTSPDQTAYGAPLADPSRAAAVLRARASAVGVALAPASDVDLIAATLGAHCWAVATGRGSLTGYLPPEVAAALAPVLLRSAGQGAQLEDVSGQWCAVVSGLPDRHLAAIEPVLRWARARAGDSVVGIAAHDLAGSSMPQVVAAAQHLAALAQDLHEPSATPQASARARPTTPASPAGVQ